MTAIRIRENISEYDYFAMEDDSPVRLEFVDGQVYAMTGATGQHNIITGNFYGLLWNFLKGKPCIPFMDGMKVKVEQNYFYPDIVVDCAFDPDNSTVAGEPVLIIEVLSPSTANYDLGVKFDKYTSIKSLQEYVIVEQTAMQIDLYRKADGSQNWQATRYGAGDTVELTSVGLSVAIEEIYDRITLLEELKLRRHRTKQK